MNRRPTSVRVRSGIRNQGADTQAAKKWSDPKNWLMGIAATLIASFIAWFAGHLYNPELKDAERTAVFSLANDLRSVEFVFRMVYLNQHEFMKPEWRKELEQDTYWESLTFPENLVRFGHFVGRKGIAGGMLEPRIGQANVKIIGLEKLDYGSGDVRYVGTAERVEEENQGKAEIDLKATWLYSTQPGLLPPKLASHLNDFSLPTSIKTALHGFVRATGPVSFKSVASGKTDFLLVFPDTSVNTAYSMRLKEDTPLYSFNGIGTAYDFVERSVDLVETMEAWEKRYSISLNLFLMPGPTSNSSKP